jgi:hypothetical protein
MNYSFKLPGFTFCCSGILAAFLLLIVSSTAYDLIGKGEFLAVDFNLISN